MAAIFSSIFGSGGASAAAPASAASTAASALPPGVGLTKFIPQAQSLVNNPATSAAQAGANLSSNFSPAPPSNALQQARSVQGISPSAPQAPMLNNPNTLDQVAKAADIGQQFTALGTAFETPRPPIQPLNISPVQSVNLTQLLQNLQRQASQRPSLPTFFGGNDNV